MTLSTLPESREIIRQAIATAGPSGVTLTQLCALVPQQTRQQINLYANGIMRYGRAYKVGSGRWEALQLRWFATAEQAATWLAKQAPPEACRTRTRKQHDAKIAEDLEAKRRHDLATLERRRAGQRAGDPVLTERTRITIATTPPSRYAPTEPITGGFASMGPGHYAGEVSGWAAALTKGQ